MEQWKTIEYDTRYQVSNFGRFRKKNPKKGYRYLKPFRKRNLFFVKIKDKDFSCARLVANAFIRKLSSSERVYHKNKIENDNCVNNLKIVSLQELGKLTGHISKSQRVIEVKGGEINRIWSSARKAAKDLFVSYQTVVDYCNRKVQQPMFNLRWEDDYFDEVFEPFSWESKKRKRR